MQYSALIGNPVKQSVSPTLFHLFGESTGTEYGHVKVRLDSADKLAAAVTSFETLGFVGFNVTLPYKQAVIPHLHELDPKAKRINAVNTVVLKDGKRRGYNTDCWGAMNSIATRLRPITREDRVLVLGSGGAARALVHGAYESTKRVTILGREATELARLADELREVSYEPDCRPWTDASLREALRETNFLLNATPVGMVPKSDEDPVGSAFDEVRDIESLQVFDAIFNPYRTRMLLNAAARGAQTCSGLWMMIYQAVEAFRLWTGQEVDEATCVRAHDILRARVTSLE